MSTQFQNKVAIVTGAAAGIGLALSQALIEHGARVIAADIDVDGLSRLQEQHGAGRFLAQRTDVSHSEQVQALVQGAVSSHGHVDFMFNNAGINLLCDARDLNLERWNRLLDVNLRGVIHGVDAVYPIFVDQGHGHIVNVASLAGFLPSPAQVVYATTKHAIMGLSISLRSEARLYGVRVSVVCPGWVDTSMRFRQELIGMDREVVNASVPGGYFPVAKSATHILRGVAKNQEIIFTPRLAGWLHKAQRYFPGLVRFGANRVAARLLD